MSSADAVLFDLDGTLIDTQELILSSMRHATREVLQRTVPDSELMALVGQPLATQMRVISPSHAQELLEVYRSYNHRIHDSMVREYSGISSMLAALKGDGIPMAIVTSKMHALAMRGVDILGYREYFEFLIGSDDCEKHKPDPAPVALAVQRLGFDPLECLYVGDSPYDIEAGNRAGCKTVAVSWGMFDMGCLREALPTYEAMIPGDIVRIAQGNDQSVMASRACSQ